MAKEEKMQKQQVRKYFVKGSWIFNLEAMHDKLWCIIYDMRDGIIDCPIEIAGTICKNEDDVQEILDEAYELEWAAKSRKVTGREYGRIKEMVEWRVYQRYATCMANGMSDRDAGVCFADV